MSAGSCERCGAERSHLHRHRIIPGSEGGEYVEGNIALICANCHEDEHRSPFGQAVRAARRRAEREARIPKEEMERLYVTEGLTMREIAAHLGTAKSNVQLWITEYGIPKRVGSPVSVRPTKEDLIADLQHLGSQTAVAEKYGVTRPAVSVWCKHYDIVDIVDGRKTRWS